MSDTHETGLPQPQPYPGAEPLPDKSHVVETTPSVTGEDVEAARSIHTKWLSTATDLADIANDPEAFKTMPPEKRRALIELAQATREKDLDAMLGTTGARRVHETLEAQPQPDPDESA